MSMTTRTRQKKCTCRQIFRRMCDTLGADLGSPECQAMREHVGQCANCTAYLASLKTTVDLFAAYPSPKLPARAQAELLRALKSKKHTG